MDAAERRHYQRVQGYDRAARRLLARAAEEAARRAGAYRVAVGEDPFTFEGAGGLGAEVERLLRGLHRRLVDLLAEAVGREWEEAERGADGLARRWLRRLGLLGREPTALARRDWFARNGAARDAFAARRAGGLTLSERVWNLTEQFGRELELAVDRALREGTPAAGLAREVKRYLLEPARLYRRVQGADGRLRLSKAARAYHPGAGVYRSSYMNARRLAVTETNMAYRAADAARWAKMDFVEGVEVRLSHNHNCKGVPAGTFHDICDELAGVYPRDFVFVGWHPHCRCYAVPLLAGAGAAELDGEGGGGGGAGAADGRVTDVPAAFTAWGVRNRGRLARSAAAGRLPYFIRDNFRVGADGRLSARFGAGDGARGAAVLAAARGAEVAAGRDALAAARREWDTYRGRRGWVGVHFDARSGGFVAGRAARVLPRRADGAPKSKNMLKVLEKEVAMCRAFAARGYQMLLLEEVPRVSSPDVLINGVPAELKSLQSAKQIVARAKKAVGQQGAELVLFEFNHFSEGHAHALRWLSGIGIHGLYYVDGDFTVRAF